MTPITPEQERRVRWLRDSGILPTVQRQMKRLGAAYHWLDSHHIVDSASICFVHTGHRLIGVSAHHVHLDAVRALDANPDVACQLGGCTFDPRERVIDESPLYDLVTYDLSEIQVNQAQSDVHYAPTWPPRLDDSGVVLVGGWLDALREDHESHTTHRFLHVAAHCERATETQIGVPIYMSTSFAWGSAGLPPGTELGGLSGGPVFQVVENPLTKLFLVGVIFEYSPEFELVLARPLSLVEADGRIRES